jgi:hypothetical protein
MPTTNDGQALITDKEMEQLILALTRSGEAFSEEDAQQVLLWVAEIRIGTGMIALALKGKKALLVRNGEVCLTNNQEPL